jgi:hypothetical protein
MSASDNLLAGLIDYAGLYPPASLDMRSAVRNYKSYMNSKYSWLLGRFVIDLNRIPELCEIADDFLCDMRLSVIASPAAESANLQHFFRDGLPIDSIEIKTSHPSEIKYIDKLVSSGLTMYFEVPFSPAAPEALDAIASIGARVKLRTGGLVADAFPASEAVGSMLEILANRRIPFKATAGLHHPVRGCYPLTYAPDSAVGIMHGFVNLFLAAALLHSGGTAEEARQLLDEESPEAFSISSDTIAWSCFRWSANQLRTIREEFAVSFGSCSFEEPIHDLKAMGWLL